MKSDKLQFETALYNWDKLHSQQEFSVAPDVGRVAIVCSYLESLTLPGMPGSDYVREDDWLVFRKEAFSIALDVQEQGRKPKVFLNASFDDMTAVLQDRSFSDVVVIGNGSFSSLNLPGRTSIYYDWRQVAHDADHLKQGEFIQRMCGTYSRDLSVPLGLFAVTDPRNIYAAAGWVINPDRPDHPHNDLFSYISDESRLTYDAIKARFPRQQDIKLPKLYPPAPQPKLASGNSLKKRPVDRDFWLDPH